jgi:hypothetical protein
METYGEWIYRSTSWRRMGSGYVLDHVMETYGEWIYTRSTSWRRMGSGYILDLRDGDVWAVDSRFTSSERALTV